MRPVLAPIDEEMEARPEEPQRPEAPQPEEPGVPGQPQEEDEGYREQAVAVAAPAPHEPTREERERHEIAHTPFRAWCQDCVDGRGRNLDHKLMEAERGHQIPTISMDYAFFGDGEGEAAPTLVMREHRTRATESHPVTTKGGGVAWIRKKVAEAIKRTGLKQFIFKTDQEPSIIELKRRVVEELPEGYQVTMEESPVNEHEANGTIERAVSTVSGFVRTLKVALERSYGKIDQKHVIVPWLIEYAGTVATLFEVGADGRTAYQRQRGKRYNQPLAPFGECVHYLPLDRERGKKAKLQPKWKHGIFLGVRVGTGELFIGTSAGTVRARAIRRRCPSERHQRSELDAMVGSPWKPHPSAEEGDEAPAAVYFPIDNGEGGELALPLQRGPIASGAGGVPGPRRVYIRAGVELKRFGFTANCPGCTAAAEGTDPRSHNEECRTRIEKAMAEDPSAKARLEAATSRRQPQQELQADAQQIADGGMDPGGQAGAEAPRMPDEADAPVERAPAPAMDVQVGGSSGSQSRPEDLARHPAEKRAASVPAEDRGGASQRVGPSDRDVRGEKRSTSSEPAEQRGPTQRQGAGYTDFRGEKRKSENQDKPGDLDVLYGEQRRAALQEKMQVISNITDVWAIRGETLVRKHRRPRRTLFTPDSSGDCPWPIDDMSATRSTVLRPVGQKHGSEQEIFDGNWHLNEVANDCLSFDWIGETIFTMKGGDDDAIKELNMLASQLGTVGSPDVRAHIAEVYNPARFTEAARRWGLSPGHVFDLAVPGPDGEPWDLSDPKQQERCMEMLARQKPKLLVGSPPCSAFSSLMRLSASRRTPEQNRRLLDQGLIHLKFVCKLYEQQLQAGLLFLHEHPASASSWGVAEIKSLLRANGVEKVTGDQCVFNQTTVDYAGDGPGLVLKPTGWLSNCPEILKELSVRCANTRRPEEEWHRHIPLLNGKAKATEVYPPKLVAAVIRGLRNHLRQEGEINEFLCGKTIEEDPFPTSELYEGMYDEVTGDYLDPVLVRKGVQDELRYMKDMGVMEEALVSDCVRDTGRPPISTRWVMVNKGDRERPEIRCRFVARELKALQERAGEFRDDTFAATPPLEAVRLLFSLCMTGDTARRGKIVFIDVSRAHFHAPSRRTTYVQLPTEWAKPGVCGKLLKSLYGTRDAAANFAECVRVKLIQMGFEIGRFSPCLAYHPTQKIILFYHGDDFVAGGDDEATKWFEKELGKHFIIKVRSVLGDEADDDHETTLLNRVIRWKRSAETNDGNPALELEADSRHAEIVCHMMGLSREDSDRRGSTAKTAPTPGVKRTRIEWEASKKLTDSMASRYRSICMRIAYLSLDRPDIVFSAKEAARHMAQPTELAWEGLKRIARFLHGRPRLVQTMRWQQSGQTARATVDADHAGCSRTRRSTSGLVLWHGSHVLKVQSATQTVVATSTGEAEFYGIVRGTAAILGLMGILNDYGQYGFDMECETDATAGRGMMLKRGVGKNKHMDTKIMWAQSVYVGENSKVKLNKVDTEKNESDIATKVLDPNRVDQHLCSMGYRYCEGASSLALRAAVG